MLGSARLNLKLSLLLLAPAVAVVLGWFYLPHFVFTLLLACVGIGALSVAVGRDAFRQARRVAVPSPAASAAPQPRARRAEARAARRGEVLLHPDTTVTLSDERAAAGVDDVFTSLDNELVGLVPVKKKAKALPPLLLVDRERRKFGLSAPRPNLHMCFTGDPGTGKTTVALRMADLLHRLRYLETGPLVPAIR